MSSDSTLSERAAVLREKRSNLHAAEQACTRIPVLVERAQEAKQAGDGARESGSDGEAQRIRERLAEAKQDFDEARRDLIRAVRIAAALDDRANRVLAQVQQLSPYPSVRAADEILGLVDLLSLAVPDLAHAAASPPGGLLPEERPSEDDRRLLAVRLEHALATGRHNLKSLRREIRVAEATFNRLLKAQPVRPTTWRKAVAFLNKLRAAAAP